MQIKIKHEFIGEIINFLVALNVKGKQNRHRIRFVNALQHRYKQIAEEEMELIKEYAGVDDEGLPKRKDNDSFDVQDVKGFKKQQEDLFAEEFVLEGGDNHGMLKTMKSIVFNYDEEVSGRTAFVFNHLYEAFDNAKEEKESAE